MTTETTRTADCSDLNLNIYGFFQNATLADVQRYLVIGIDVNVGDEGGFTPLHAVARHANNPAMIKALIDAGADPDVQDKDDWTPLHWAVGFNTNPAVVQTLIDKGADVNVRGFHDWTPLHMAVGLNRTAAVVQALIDAGADIGARDKDGHMPFDVIPDDSPITGTEVYELLKKARSG